MNISKIERANLAQLNRASSYQEWSEIAKAIDSNSGADEWRRDEANRHYDYRRIRDRLEALRHARKTKNHQELLYSLNEGIHGNLGGIANPRLYQECVFGTKDLITDYMIEVEKSIDHLARLTDKSMPFDERIDFFRRASHCFGRSALMLSGAGSLTPYHVGVTQALYEEGLLPNIISGSSGGAIVAAVIGSRSRNGLATLFAEDGVESLNLGAEEKRRLTLWMKPASPEQLDEFIETLIPDLTFEEAFEKSGRYINISVATAESFHRSRLLNVITTPHVFLRDAVRASCSVPGVYAPVSLSAKDYDGQRKPYLPEIKWIDGAVSDDLPARRLARLYGVNHFIASQTNPIALWAINDRGFFSEGPQKAFLEWSTQLARANLRATRPLAERLSKQFPAARTATHTFYSVALQNYLADVNILPRRRVYDPRRLLAEITRAEYRTLVTEGRRATWPKIELIRNSTRVSRRLDAVLDRYERRAEKRAADEILAAE